ncbi:riboflavin synthase [uncultured Megasphaera sp.]|uniref:riboflavin synthase n=1 Tax=uncultured Megasphaera sp. TaxID=165188 RepID=UPI0026581A3A|nr:riboflavin synthase [uncultured Megasphaera sp.]
MFTGIIEELGTVTHLDRQPDSIQLTIQAEKVLEGTQLGDSIAVNGVCLTVTAMTDSSFTADVMHETMRRSSLKDLRTGASVNLERAMALGGRLGGHIVSGHVDGMGHISRIATDGIARVITISIPKEMEPFIVEKGSIAIDGISLTVVSVGSSQFSVSIIPHTMSHTTLLDKHPGAAVNLETDIIGKYVHSFTVGSGAGSKSSGLTMETLLQHGF